ncbi:hypothetical protein N7509_013733 [Penicillium cosmopolitanum]|uniref:C2H2-type domain-containing protein n=1 Tax=Penicillium cosmopolitanum TaxID=1131564 RepID=A0A9W9SEW3_9EURO|nr:uncharacterized protein N7509_013733 [Penicillium cosmopolitanum]KAJ5376847.1 hypothetical protein N7509_013733 [Penicillium cosmopolitanum]
MDLANLLHAAPKRACPEDYEYPTTYKRSPQPPLSPPVEDQPKCSLPSITALLEGADGHSAKRQRLSPPAHQRDARYDTIHLPPTPPLRPGSGSGHHHSHSSSPVEAKDVHRASISSTSSHSHHHHHHGPYASPAPSLMDPCTTALKQPQPSRLASHQPSPTLNQAPRHTPSSLCPNNLITPAWQHHHYFPPSTATPYQQNHDRYICRTCHKAFSRPSSLRIHSHSHTGEKPFRCTHAGCGKAFSVRSNMKRHERGCHSGRAVPPPATALVA